VPRSLSRRCFLSQASGAALALGSRLDPAGAATARPARARPATSEVEPLRQLLVDPPPSAKPMTRWWWFGGAVTPEEITRELTFMRDAGLRGAEIQPVYPLAVDDPRRGIRHLRYYTDEWFEVLRHAVREARRLGLQLDFTLGSGWPYGGPFIPTSLAARRLRVLSQDVVGPQAYSWLLAPHLTGDDRVVAVVATPVLPNQELDLGRSQVLTDQPVPETTFNVGSDLWIRDWRVPEGEWRLMVVVDSPTGQQVKRPTLGMEGNVVDHLSREAVQLFLRAAGDRVLDALRRAGDPPFHSVFCDSLEVYGADWTQDFLKEFGARRGYDLAPYLPALWHEAGPKTPHVRYDFHLTLSELMLDHFFRPLAEWSGRRGMKARVQAHGALGDVMQAYGLADIPEGENIFLGDRYMVNLRHRRLASSAAHQYGKPIVSAETYTWLRTPLYTTTLEMMKAATDSVFLDGVNHVVNHGYSYSPPEAGEPGWAFYASTEINHTNTWWRHYPHLARYVQRTQALLQQGVSINPVGVYLPLADIYARFGAGGLGVDAAIERHVGTALFSSLRQAGYDFDAVHDHAIAAMAHVERGRLRVGTAAYSVIIVPTTRWMPPESAARLAEFSSQGGHLIFIERCPEGAPGLADQEKRSAEVRRSIAGLWGGREPGLGMVAAAGRGTVALAADPAAALGRLETVLGPDFRIAEAGDGSAPVRRAATENVGFLHRRAADVDYYLVANVSGRPHDLRARFAVGHRAPERWDAETGAMSFPAYEYVSNGQGKQTEVGLHLDSYEACFVVFGSSGHPPLVTRTTLAGPLRVGAASGGIVEVTGQAALNGVHEVTLASGRTLRVDVKDVPDPIAVEGPWTLRLGQVAPLPLGRLRSWDELPEGRTFSGWATYEATFDVARPGEDVEWMLDLGEVHETAEVSLNGTALGAAWRNPRRLACAGALRTGHNLLVIEVANLWVHHMAAQPPPLDWKVVEETVGIRWGRYGEVKPETMPPAGLLGPVRLVPLKRVRVKASLA